MLLYLTSGQCISSSEKRKEEDVTKNQGRKEGRKEGRKAERKRYTTRKTGRTIMKKD